MAPSAINLNGQPSSAKIDVFNNYANWINGKAHITPEKRHGVNPATLENLPDVPVSTREDVEAAVKSAREAFKSWKAVPVEERQAAVTKFAEALQEVAGDFAKLLTTEQGKPLALAQAEVAGSHIWMEAMAKITLKSEIIQETETKQTIERYTPLGVCVGIVPWNFPLQLACGKIAPALVTGNTNIIKPSPFTPYCGIKLVELAQQFFPPGVVQVLSGNDSLGPWLIEHIDVDKISFTGSIATGKRVMQSAAGTLKRITLELGGNDPAIVCEDVDIETVAPTIATLAFANSGQICIAIKRVYVQDTIYEKFRDAMFKHIKTLKLGNGLDSETSHGPVQNEMQYERVQGFIKDIESQKWIAATGGEKPINLKGYFITPTIVDGPADDSRIVVEEPFGPIVPLLSWKTESEVLARANNTRMGLGASVWTRNLERGRRIAEQIEAGSVWINSHLEVSPYAAFGGHKQSGIGSEWGLSGLKSFCNVQTLFLAK